MLAGQALQRPGHVARGGAIAIHAFHSLSKPFTKVLA